MKRSSINFISILILLALLSANFYLPQSDIKARKVTTKINLTKQSKKNRNFTGKKIDYNPRDTLLTDSLFDKVIFCGYDKPLNSSLESFIIQNKSALHISAIEITITYTDLNGRMLHRRTIPLEIDIPSGETRKHEIATWDKQHRFVYEKSTPPKHAATLYTIYINSCSITILK